MSRAYVVYILMTAMLAGGLWLILTLGDSLRAADDLSGAWTVHWDQPPQGFAPKGEMRIDQSGQFFTVHFDQGPTLKLRLREKWRGAQDGRNLSMILAGDDWTLACTGSITRSEPRRADDLRLELRRSGSSASTHTAYAARKRAGEIASFQPPPSPTPPPKTADAR